MKRSTKRKLRKAGRKISRWYRKQLATILSVVVAILCVSLVGLIVYNTFDDVIIDEDDPIYATTTTTTTTTFQKLPKPAVLEDLDFNYVSYSSVSGLLFSMNTEQLYTWFAEKDFDSIRGDVQITKDNKLVMHYYGSFRFEENGNLSHGEGVSSVPVYDLTLEECLRLRYDATGSSICTFEDYLKICKKHEKIAFVSISGAHYEEVIPLVLTALEQNEMLDRCIINSISYSALDAIREANATVALSYQQGTRDTLTTRTIDNVVELQNCIVLRTDFSTDSQVSDVENVLDKNVLAYAEERGVLIYESRVFSMKMVEKLKEYGIDGVQMPTPPHI